MTDKEKLYVINDILATSGFKRERADKKTVLEAMMEYSWQELAEEFALFINIFNDIADIVGEEKQPDPEPQDRIKELERRIKALSDMLPGELCRISVTDDTEELSDITLWAIQNLVEIRRKKLVLKRLKEITNNESI